MGQSQPIYELNLVREIHSHLSEIGAVVSRPNRRTLIRGMTQVETEICFLESRVGSKSICTLAQLRSIQAHVASPFATACLVRNPIRVLVIAFMEESEYRARARACGPIKSDRKVMNVLDLRSALAVGSARLARIGRNFLEFGEGRRI